LGVKINFKYSVNRSLLNSVSGYLIYTFVSSLIPFLLLPVLTRFLTPEQYGLVSVYSVYTAVIGSIVGLSTITAFTKTYYDDKHDSNSSLTSSFLVSVLSALALFLVVFLTSPLLGNILEIPIWWLYVGISTVLFEDIVSAKTLLYRLNNKVFKFGVYEISRILIRAVVTIILVALFDMEENSPVLAGIFASTIYMFLSLYLLHADPSVTLVLSKESLKYSLRFGVPLTPHAILGSLSSTFDKIIISIMLTKEQLGIYAVGFAIGSVIKAMEGAVYMAYQPWFFKKISTNQCDNKEIIGFSYLIFFGLLLGSVLLVVVSNNYLQYYVGDSFVGAVDIVPWIASAFAVNWVYTMANQVVMYKEKTGVISTMTALSMLVGALLSVICIKLNGIVGAAQAIFLTMLIRAISMWIYSNKLHPLGWFHREK